MISQSQCVSALILAIAVTGVSCGKSGEGGNGEKVQAVNVRTEVVVPSAFVDAIQVAGTAKAYEDVNMSPEEGGVVKEWKVKKGQYVNKGDLVVVLRDEVIKASYDAAEAQARMADLNLSSQQEVYDQKGISELQYKNLQYSRDAARANADFMKARWERTQLRSPINGVLDNTIPNEGEFAPPGLPIAHLVNSTLIKIVAEVPERYAGSITRGTAAFMTFDALPGDTLRGNVSFAGSTVSTVNRALTVEIVIRNLQHRVKPEMVAKVNLLREAKENTLVIDENIVQLVDRDRLIVYVASDGVAQERRLTFGGRQGNRVEVLSGLKAGDSLIITGYQKLVDVTPVVVTQ